MLCIFMLIKEGIICSKCDWIDVLMDESINSGEQVQTWQNRHSMRISLQNCNFIHCSANQKQRLENLFIQIHCASNRHPIAASTQYASSFNRIICILYWKNIWWILSAWVELLVASQPDSWHVWANELPLQTISALHCIGLVIYRIGWHIWQ